MFKLILIALLSFSFSVHAGLKVKPEIQKIIDNDIDNKVRLSPNYKYSDEVKKQMKLMLFQTMLANNYVKTNPKGYLEIQKKFYADNNLFIIESIKTGAKLLNLSNKQCNLMENKDYQIPINELAKKYCFSEININYFKNSDPALFRIEKINDTNQKLPDPIEKELTLHINEIVKNKSYNEYVEKLNHKFSSTPQ